MNDAEIRRYLEDNGYPRHVVEAGREGLVRRWRQFVDEVERGYRFGLEDYRNDLDLRGILAQIGLDDEVADADQRFERMLTARDRRVWESAAGDPFWDFGYPRNASADLLRDLRSAGLAE
ncbi:MAG TPA: hypothetical protein VFA04_09965 [Bryobacteraceae bacterium]|nr:hypothetical protein [Bryobacteraceae bacterium]